jgi:glycosyltransferase involved in cell wall biosynthesis
MVLRLGLVDLAPLTTGGAATYALAIKQALESIAGEVEIELVHFANEASVNRLRHDDSDRILYRKTDGVARSFAGRVRDRLSGRRESSAPTLAQVLKVQQIDLAWFLAPNRVISSVRDTPFVMTVWDLAHRDVQGFPEFSAEGRWEQREAGFSQNLGRAFHVITDSRKTGESLERIYGVYPHNWSSIGLPLPEEVTSDIGLAHSIPGPYFYYPASYWPHKNHRVLIDALQHMPETTAHLVFSGHDEGHRAKLEDYVRQQHLDNRVHFHARITDEEVQGLIDGSQAVVMPSFLGPTNYPPLEALRRGRPALVSSVHAFDFEPPDGLVFIEAESVTGWALEMSTALLSKESQSPWGNLQAPVSKEIREVLTKIGATSRASFSRTL